LNQCSTSSTSSVAITSMSIPPFPQPGTALEVASAP
jgi:hypothetical protein